MTSSACSAASRPSRASTATVRSRTSSSDSRTCSCSTFSVRSREVMPLWTCSWPASALNSSMRAFTSCRVTFSRSAIEARSTCSSDPLVVGERPARAPRRPGPAARAARRATAAAPAPPCARGTTGRPAPRRRSGRPGRWGCAAWQSRAESLLAFPQAGALAPGAAPSGGLRCRRSRAARPLRPRTAAAPGRFGGRPSPEDRPVSRRPIHGTRCSRVKRRSAPRRVDPARRHGRRQRRPPVRLRRHGPAPARPPRPPGGGPRRSDAAGRRPTSAGRPAPRAPYRSTTTAPCRSASSSMKAKSSSMRGRKRVATGPRRAGLRISTSCLQAGASRSTASSSARSTAAMSHLGRSTSLRPPTSVTRSAPIAAAAPTCSSTICPMSLPRTARFA